MKKGELYKKASMFVMFATLMLLIGMIFPATAYAEIPGDRYKAVQDIYLANSDRLEDARESFQESKDNFQNASDRLKDGRTRENILTLKQATKNHLNRTIDYAIQHLEILVIQAHKAEENGYSPFNASMNLEEYIIDLEDMKDDVASAETREDFQATITGLRNTWQHINMESRYFVMGTVNNRVDAFLERSESIAQRVQEEIDRLNEAGEDTSELERLLEEYNETRNEAKNSHERTNALFDDHAGFDNSSQLTNVREATQFLRDANEKTRETNRFLREANSKLREIFTLLKQHRPGSVDMRGTGTLTASGNGKVTLSGNMDINVSAKSGVLTIADYDGNADIEVTGHGNRTELSDSTIKYTGFNGTASINGSSITVTINGDDIELTTKGTGSAVLRGHGTYTATPDSGEAIKNDWSPLTGGDKA
ncbi:MAG: hypothetical protein M8353_01830 [ANME-2 cluster archaeon]|nr:hypothetical protein [ANME-2 cluster archaeon]